MNIQGLHSGRDNKRKIKYLSDKTLCVDDMKIIILTETHLNEEVKDAEIKIDNYNIYRADRTNRERGGVAIYLHNSLQADETNIKKFSNGICEIIILYIKELNLSIICLYRPPDTTELEFEQPIQIIDEYIKMNPNRIMILIGDMNFPQIKWKKNDTEVIPTINSGYTLDKQNQAIKLLDIANEHFLQQMIDTPTRGKNIIDLIYVSNPELIDEISVEETTKSLTDHNVIYFDYKSNKEKVKVYTDSIHPTDINSLEKYSYWSEKSDWNSMNNYLNNVDWDTKINSVTSVEEDIKQIYKCCDDASNKFIPLKRRIRKQIIPPDRRILMRKRNKLRKILSRKKNNETLRKLIEIETNIIKSIEKERLREEEKAVKAIKYNCKAFYKHIQKYAKNKTRIGPLTNTDGELENDPEKMSEILKIQYEKSFNYKKAENEITIEDELKDSFQHIDNFFDHDAHFSDIHITENDVDKAINETKLNTSAGPDYLLPILLHKCRESLLKPLTAIFNKSLKNTDIPPIWKEAVISPIYKGGDKSEAINYRGISLTSVIPKLLERIIRWYLIRYLEINDAFPDSQHGFREGRSTVSQLLEQYESIIDAYENKENIDIIMLDYSKAFDKINVSILLNKLKKLGIGGNIGKWIAKFLIGRKQRVRINGQYSSNSDIVSGVPQGTILAALLFLVYISDINEKINESTLVSYADDSKMFKRVKNLEQCEQLQSNINTIFKWTDENLMTFNTDKFEVLRIGTIDRIKNEIKYLTPDGQILIEKEVVKDLGVYINNKGDFTDHIINKTIKAKQACGCILRSFITRDEIPLMTLFRSIVQPIIDYCSVVWSPYKKKEICEIEQIQRNFTKKIKGMENLEYHERLKKLKIYSCERRRERYDILYAFKILQGKVPNVGLKVKWSQRRGKVLVPPPIMRNSSEHANTLRHNAYRSRATRLFNSIPKEIRNLTDRTSIQSIKRKLDKYLATLDDKPMIKGSNEQPSNSLVNIRRNTDSCPQ